MINGDCHKFDDSENLKIDENLIIGSTKYQKFAMTIVYPLYKKGDKIRTYRHSEKSEGDKKAGLHAISIIKTLNGFVEINNNDIFTPLREYSNVRPKALIFYQKAME